MPITVTAVPSVPDDAGLVGVPIASDATIDDELADQGFEGKLGQTARVNGRIAVGVGPAGAVDAEVIRRASAALVKAAWKRPAVVSSLLEAVPADGDRVGAAQAAAEGALLAAYRFGRYKKDAGEAVLGSVTLVAKGGKRVRDAVDRGVLVANAVTFARDLINTPAGDLTPALFADRAVEVATAAGLGVEVIDEKQAAKLGLGGLVGVGKGSENPPRMVKLTYVPTAKPRGHLALVGKGITFDSGGLSIKTGDGMMTMKTDMSGAAAVLATMSVLPTLAPPVQVTGYLCLAENMLSGRAIRPGDVLRIKNGTTVEVLNTDAEGRLVLADGLAYALEGGRPDAMVDIATLTGAIAVALGRRTAGLFSSDDALAAALGEAASRAGERVWRLPLVEDYRPALASSVADLTNVGKAPETSAGSITAALFLREFSGGVPWAHLDIANTARSDADDGEISKGGTGWGVRTLLAWLAGPDTPDTSYSPGTSYTPGARDIRDAPDVPGVPSAPAASR